MLWMVHEYNGRGWLVAAADPYQVPKSYCPTGWQHYDRSVVQDKFHNSLITITVQLCVVASRDFHPNVRKLICYTRKGTFEYYNKRIFV